MQAENSPAAKRRKVLKKIATALAVLLFWLLVWQIAAQILYRKYQVDYIFPTVEATFSALWRLLPSAAFRKTVLASVGRILRGLLIGWAAATALAFATYKWKIAAAIVSPVMTVIRATPVASFIMVLWVLIQGNENAVPSAVAFLMVMPLLWESIVQGLGARDKNLSEVLDVFGAPPARRFLLLTLPTLTDHALPALVNAVGLAWKAGIAAEIIAYTKNSIGRQIKDAKDSLEAAEMFAWTLCVIAVSLLLEALIGAVAGRYRKTIAKKEEKGRERDPGTDEAIR